MQTIAIQGFEVYNVHSKIKKRWKNDGKENRRREKEKKYL